MDSLAFVVGYAFVSVATLYAISWIVSALVDETVERIARQLGGIRVFKEFLRWRGSDYYSFEQVTDIRAEAEQRIAALEADARRYQFLRAQKLDPAFPPGWYVFEVVEIGVADSAPVRNLGDLDAAIDAAIDVGKRNGAASTAEEHAAPDRVETEGNAAAVGNDTSASFPIPAFLRKHRD